MAINFSENQINYARKKFYDKLYVTKPNLKFINNVINKTLINIYLFKFTLINFKRWIFKIIFFTFSSKNDKKIVNFTYNLNEKFVSKNFK
jgi:hypothetical protein